jgi:S-DNA-T family DNA segregation ATPase FtsK/SpoIIIE
MTRKRSTSRKKTTPRSNRRKTTRRKSSRRSRPRIDLSLDLQQKAIIVGISLIFFTAIVVLSLLSPNQGQLTTVLSRAIWQLFGWGSLVIPIAFAVGGFYLVLWGMEQPPKLPTLRVVGLVFLFVSVEAFASLAWVAMDNGLDDVISVAQAGEGGGYAGGFLVWLLTQGIGGLGTIFVLLVMGIVAVFLVSGVQRAEIVQFVTNLFDRASRKEEVREIPINNGRTSIRTNLPEVGQQAELLPTDQTSQAPATAATTATAAATATKKKSKAKEPARKATKKQPAGQERVVAPTPVFAGHSNDQVWELPELEEVLEPGDEQDMGSAYIREQVEVIEHTLESFGAPASVVDISQGPTITQYGVEPSFIEQRSGKRTKVKVGKIASLADDLALALAARSIRIQAPVPGKGYVGIEVPNSDKALVSLRDVMESAEFQSKGSPLRIGLGQNVAGQPIAADLDQMPHLLIAGTTGSGKSVCVNSIIACLLLKNTPQSLKLVMVDPKRVELTGYNGIPHLVAPVVVDLDRVVGTLQWAMREMDNRYKRLAELGARNIVEFNKKAAGQGEETMPNIVIVIDELADLMMLSPEDTERGITRLAQLARATGIHMVIATQRPSVDVVTGLIKANFPARIAFAVASSTDSRVILDTTGAERLLGQGDMLFQSPDAAAPIRMQGCFVSERELHKIIDYWRGARRQGTAAGAPAAPASVTPAAQSPAAGVETLVEAESEATPQQPLWEEMREVEEEAARHSDDLLPEAVALVRQLDKASTSLLQRHFRIGYTRAARLIDIMEEDGIIGPPTGTSKARKVLPYAGDEADDLTSNGESQS